MALLPKVIPVSNSKASMALRAAALETAISKSLSEIIFVDLCTRSSSGVETNTLRTVSREVKIDNDQRLPLLRSLLATSSELQNCRRNDLTASFVDQMVTIYKPILDLSDSQVEYCKDLSQLVTEADDLWLYIQRHRDVVEVVCTDQAASDWDFREDYGSISEDAEPQSSTVLAILFPSFRKRSAAGSLAVLHLGCALWSDQQSSRVGMEEHRIQAERVNGSFSGNFRRSRRLSTSHALKSVQTPLEKHQV